MSIRDSFRHSSLRGILLSTNSHDHQNHGQNQDDGVGKAYLKAILTYNCLSAFVFGIILIALGVMLRTANIITTNAPNVDAIKSGGILLIILGAFIVVLVPFAACFEVTVINQRRRDTWRARTYHANRTPLRSNQHQQCPESVTVIQELVASVATEEPIVKCPAPASTPIEEETDPINRSEVVKSILRECRKSLCQDKFPKMISSQKSLEEESGSDSCDHQDNSDHQENLEQQENSDHQDNLEHHDNSDRQDSSDTSVHQEEEEVELMETKTHDEVGIFEIEPNYWIE